MFLSLQSYADFPKLERSLATLYETLRLHPPVVLIPKEAAEDVYLQDETFEHKSEASESGGEKVELRQKKEEEAEAWRGEGRKVFVPKGTRCNIDVVNLREYRIVAGEGRAMKLIGRSGWGLVDMHPAYWENAQEFKPERFLGEYNKDAFQPFSSGPRGEHALF